ncbi:MAG: hypothetical protein WD358_08310 [Nitriliruptoraceae bacterium]
MAIVTAALATGVSAMFAVTLLRRWWARGRSSSPLLIWGVALVMFCVASLGLLTGVVGGWTSMEFRTFYLFGGVLNVPWLALGSIAVNARSIATSRWTGGILVVIGLVVARQAVVAEEPALWVPSAVLALLWGAVLLIGRERTVIGGAALALLVYSAAATWVVVSAPYVATLPSDGLPEGALLFAPFVRGFAVGGNSIGAITVVVSALVSSAALVWRRPDRQADSQVLSDVRTGGYADAIARWIFRGRTGQGPALAHLVRGNLMIALGVAIAAAGGVLSFLGDTVGHAIGFTIGVTVMYTGFVRTTRPTITSTDDG